MVNSREDVVTDWAKVVAEYNNKYQGSKDRFHKIFEVNGVPNEDVEKLKSIYLSLNEKIVEVLLVSIIPNKLNSSGGYGLRKYLREFYDGGSIDRIYNMWVDDNSLEVLYDTEAAEDFIRGLKKVKLDFLSEITNDDIEDICNSTFNNYVLKELNKKSKFDYVVLGERVLELINLVGDKTLMKSLNIKSTDDSYKELLTSASKKGRVYKERFVLSYSNLKVEDLKESDKNLVSDEGLNKYIDSLFKVEDRKIKKELKERYKNYISDSKLLNRYSYGIHRYVMNYYGRYLIPRILKEFKNNISKALYIIKNKQGIHDILKVLDLSPYDYNYLNMNDIFNYSLKALRSMKGEEAAYLGVTQPVFNEAHDVYFSKSIKYSFSEAAVGGGIISDFVMGYKPEYFFNHYKFTFFVVNDSDLKSVKIPMRSPAGSDLFLKIASGELSGKDSVLEYAKNSDLSKSVVRSVPQQMLDEKNIKSSASDFYGSYYRHLVKKPYKITLLIKKIDEMYADEIYKMLSKLANSVEGSKKESVGKMYESMFHYKAEIKDLKLGWGDFSKISKSYGISEKIKIDNPEFEKLMSDLKNMEESLEDIDSALFLNNYVKENSIGSLSKLNKEDLINKFIIALSKGKLSLIVNKESIVKEEKVSNKEVVKEEEKVSNKERVVKEEKKSSNKVNETLVIDFLNSIMTKYYEKSTVYDRNLHRVMDNFLGNYIEKHGKISKTNPGNSLSILLDIEGEKYYVTPLFMCNLTNLRTYVDRTKIVKSKLKGGRRYSNVEKKNIKLIKYICSLITKRREVDRFSKEDDEKDSRRMKRFVSLLESRKDKLYDLGIQFKVNNKNNKSLVLVQTNNNDSSVQYVLNCDFIYNSLEKDFLYRRVSKGNTIKSFEEGVLLNRGRFKLDNMQFKFLMGMMYESLNLRKVIKDEEGNNL